MTRNVLIVHSSAVVVVFHFSETFRDANEWKLIEDNNYYYDYDHRRLLVVSLWNRASIDAFVVVVGANIVVGGQCLRMDAWSSSSST